MLFHGVHKLINGHDFIKGILSEKGLPQFLWLGVPLAEIIAPVLLILGIFTRISGLSTAVVMFFSIFLAFGTKAFSLTPYGGLLAELNILFLFAGLTLFFTGGGKYSLYKSKNEWLS
jgi:putative oxidoreductase